MKKSQLIELLEEIEGNPDIYISISMFLVKVGEVRRGDEGEVILDQ